MHARDLLLAAPLVLALTGAPAGASTIFDIPVANLVSVGPLGHPLNSVIVLDVASALGFAHGTQLTVTGIGWDLDLTALAPSWLDDMTARIGSIPLGSRDVLLTPALLEERPGSGRYASPVQSLSQLGLQNFALIGGVSRIEFYEHINDFTDGAPEGLWSSGFIRLRIFENAPPPPVPLPRAGVMGLAGLAAIASLRRRWC